MRVMVVSMEVCLLSPFDNHEPSTAARVRKRDSMGDAVIGNRNEVLMMVDVIGVVCQPLGCSWVDGIKALHVYIPRKTGIMTGRGANVR